PPTTGKVAAVAPIPIGTASNAYTCIRGQQNQVAANDSLNLITFIHRQDISIHGGQATDNGQYRYDISTDGGLTWSKDVGALQATYTNYGRYPNATLFNPGTTSNPFDAKMVWGGPTNHFPTPGWLDHVYGTADIATSGTPASSEDYHFSTDQTLIPGSMTQGLPGEFWMIENQYNGTVITDTIRVMKGVWNSAAMPPKVEWTVAFKIDPGFDKTFDGTPNGSSPVIAFGPDGMNGWIAMTGNITNGSNTASGVILPIFMKTTDGGATWGSAYEVNLDNIPWIKDSLQSLWVDSMNNPAGSGLAFCLYRNFDLTVDNNGNPHFATVIYNASGADDFTFSPSFAKFLGDVYSPDGGATWEVSYLSPILAYDKDFGSTNTVNMSTFVQASRSEDGRYLFFSWPDSDTSQFTGSMNGIGFGDISNIAPNLRICAKRVSDGGQTYPKLVSDGDLTWEGRVLYPTMAPITRKIGGKFHLPIVSMELTLNDANQTCSFFYWGNDAVIDFTTANFCQWQNGMELSWSVFSDPGFTGSPCVVNVDDNVGQNDIILHQSFPNPTSGEAVIGFELPAVTSLNIELVNMYGQQVAVLAKGEFNAGSHRVVANTADLAAGVYFYNLRTADQIITKKMIVTK
ncbi:MAG TPA: T9SS type A sorting domain-containing protein, partial [Bacteroidetes bacterium]|nr:T9SS type A sorting domain-containing protein [Bacteroidota bacterium]